MWLNIILAAFIYAIISLVFASIFHSLLNRRLLGGFWGAFGVGFAGAAIGAPAFDVIFCKLAILLDKIVLGINWLMRNSDHEMMPPINVLAAIAGSVLFIYILKKMTPN